MPPPVGQQRLDLLFPNVEPDPPDHTFELGLVLGGTVSAGAFTAGALDFLLQALEAWNARANRPHDVVIKTAAGSSGGAVCAAILGLVSGQIVPHVDSDQTLGGDPPDAKIANPANPVPTGNPFWDLWINGFSIERLMALGDMDADVEEVSGVTTNPVQHVPSLVNCAMIDDGAKQLVAFGSRPAQPLAYFSAPFRVAITVANLRGIPYRISNIPILGDFSGAAYVEHDDFAWFAFPNGASPVPTVKYVGKREDEFWLSPTSSPNTVTYETLAAYAVASGAMPLGLSARALSRPVEHYHFRPKVRPSVDAPGFTVDWPQPDMTGMCDASGTAYDFTAVDGGTFNNDPVSLVHRALAGLLGHNPRGKSDACRAILMIDPLADQPKPIPQVGKSLVAVAKSIVGAFVSSSRYLTADMDLFADENVFSRFQLVPFRPEPLKVGEAALAGSSLFAAAGWCARAYRVHDFFLGRQNMARYLNRELVLAGDNPLFRQWSDDDRQKYAVDLNGDPFPVLPNAPKGGYYLPVIPLVADIAVPPVPEWPVNLYDPDTLTPLLSDRLTAVVQKLVSDNSPSGPLPWFVEVLAVPKVVNILVDKIIAGFKDDLTTKWKLLTSE